MSSTADLRAKGARMLADARSATDPGRRAALWEAAALTLRAARRAAAAEYAVEVGRSNVTRVGYREWIRAQVADPHLVSTTAGARGEIAPARLPAA
jgi:hypothetical protein